MFHRRQSSMADPFLGQFLMEVTTPVPPRFISGERGEERAGGGGAPRDGINAPIPAYKPESQAQPYQRKGSNLEWQTLFGLGGHGPPSSASNDRIANADFAGSGNHHSRDIPAGGDDVAGVMEGYVAAPSFPSQHDTSPLLTSATTTAETDVGAALMATRGTRKGSVGFPTASTMRVLGADARTMPTTAPQLLQSHQPGPGSLSVPPVGQSLGMEGAGVQRFTDQFHPSFVHHPLQPQQRDGDRGRPWAYPSRAGRTGDGGGMYGARVDHSQMTDRGAHQHMTVNTSSASMQPQSHDASRLSTDALLANVPITSSQLLRRKRKREANLRAVARYRARRAHTVRRLQARVEHLEKEGDHLRKLKLEGETDEERHRKGADSGRDIAMEGTLEARHPSSSFWPN